MQWLLCNCSIRMTVVLAVSKPLLGILSRLFSTKSDSFTPGNYSAHVTVQSFLLMHTHNSHEQYNIHVRSQNPLHSPCLSGVYNNQTVMFKKRKMSKEKKTVQVASLLLSSPVIAASLLCLDTISIGSLLVLCVDTTWGSGSVTVFSTNTSSGYKLLQNSWPCSPDLTGLTVTACTWPSDSISNSSIRASLQNILLRVIFIAMSGKLL